MESPLSIEQIKKGRALTYREARYVKARIEGKNVTESMKAAGFSAGYCHTPHEFPSIDIMNAEVDRLQAELSANTIQECLIDATEIHEYLTEALRAKITDIRRDDGSFLPTSEWPEIWQRMFEAGDCEIETLSGRSTDGETKDKRGGWDSIGTVTKVKLKFASKVKLLELAMKHRGVNAMVDQKAGDVNIHVHAEVVQKLQGALARKEQLALEESRNVTPQ